LTNHGKGIRKHKHFRVTITYSDNEQSGKVFISREKAENFVMRQKKSPVVKSGEITAI
jgi:hypothetical protein